MDDLDAPQWADFLAPSPQVCLDDYFLRKHDDHEYREKLDSAESDSPNISIKNESIIHKTPVRILGPKGNKSSSSRKNKVKETTYENVLMEAMNNLQLSFKKPHGDKSLNKSCLVDSPAFKTPVKRVTRSMCAQVANSPQVNLDESHYATPSHEKTTAACDHEQPRKHEHQHEQPHGHDEHQHDLDESNKENIDIGEHGSPVNEQTSEINLEVTVISTEHDATLEKSEPEQEIEVEPEPDKGTQNDETHIPSKLPSKIVTSFATQNTGPDSGSKKKVATLTGNAWKRQMKRRMSITNQRRMSVHKPPPVTNKYVSMAEAVTKFHRTTPQRFHTTHVKTTRTEQLRRMSFKLTRATSPALLSKTRTRPVTAMSREEKERLELEKIRQNQIKANPVRKDILRKPAPLKRVQKKMVTNPEPFHLTEVKKGQLPKQNPEVKRLYRMKTKTVPAIVSTSDKQVIVQDEEILHFGIPLEPCKIKKKITKVMPFSFEARNKESQMKKQEKMKMMQETEQQKNKAEFHARPVPATGKTPLNPKPALKNNSLHKPKITIARSLSFEDRNKQLQLKKEEKIKQLLEEEKKARSFRAQKVPEFKPVLVKGRSRDNLNKKSQENLAVKPAHVSGNIKKTDNSLKKSRDNLVAGKQMHFIKKPVSIPFVGPKKTSPATVTTSNENQENQGVVPPKILEPKCKLSQKSVAVLTELNTDKRAKQRREFDEHLKKKEMEEEELRKREEQERIAREKAEKYELRKMTETRARPMPVFKPMNILKSNKPLTDAKSPAWTNPKGSMH